MKLNIFYKTIWNGSVAFHDVDTMIYLSISLLLGN